LEKKTLVKFIIIFIIGCAIGAIFYPSKTIIKTLEVDNELDKKVISELQKKVQSLESTNKKLESEERIIHVRNTDGSERTETVRVSKEYETRTKEIKESYEQRIAEYQKEIAKLKEYNKVEINKRSVGVEVGMMLDRSYYGHVQADVFGPIFLGGHVSLGNSLGIGIGVRF